MRLTRLVLMGVAIGFGVCAVTVDAVDVKPAAEGVKFFETHIRPMFIKHCYKCHSTNAKRLRGGLYLDSRAGWATGGDSGPAISPGDLDKSLLIRAIHWKTEDIEMPPKGKLAKHEIALFEKWVRMGAPDPRTGGRTPSPAKRVIDIEAGRAYWAFRPLWRGEAPKVKNVKWAPTPVDQFIVAKLEAKGLKPVGRASRRQLIRRVYLGLIGLPPTPAEVDAYIKDQSPKAWEKVVDRLLADRRFGERWARHWLDVARFGESEGFEHDYDRKYAYHYRDFVIRAFNEDLPYDQFVKWQLAGDELEPNNPQALMATGFLSAGVFPTQLTEAEFESARYDQMDDMAATTGSAFLGLTVGCARCHDHKFDPITVKDYYRFVASFATTIRNEMTVDLSTPRERLAAKKAKAELVRARKAALDTFERTRLPRLFDAYLAKVRRNGVKPAGWQVLNISKIQTKSGTRFSRQADDSLLAVGKTPAKDVYTFIAHIKQEDVTAIRLEALTHKSLPRGGPGLAFNGNFALGDIRVTVKPLAGKGVPVVAKLTNARATHQQNSGSLSVRASIDKDGISGWAVDRGGIGKDQAAVFEFAKPIGFKGGMVLTVTLRFEHGNGRHAMGRPRLSVTTAPPPVKIKGESGPDKATAELLMAIAAGKVKDVEKIAAARLRFAPSVAEWRRLKGALDTALVTKVGDKNVRIQVTTEGLKRLNHHANGRGYPHFYKQVYLLKRGDAGQKLEPVSQSFLSVLMRDGRKVDHWTRKPPAGWRTSYRRRNLADWIMDTKHGAGHLAARVMVNRLWQHHFGRGLVLVANDFGNQSQPPSHPKLLDWLAGELIKGKWSLKRIHKMMLMSEVYKRAVAADSQNERMDIDNIYHWRRDRRRLEGEAIRDSMLYLAGLLDNTMYGPGTLNESMRRRSIYFTVKRSRLIPMMQLFDWPEPLTSQGRRASTTIAPQALLMLNNGQVRGWARAFGKRVSVEGENDLTGLVQSAYRMALSRAPDANELKDSVGFIRDQWSSYRAAGKRDAFQLAVTDFAQVMLCLNEFFYVD